MAQISKRYATSLFELAIEANAVDAYSEQAQGLITALLSSAELVTALRHPGISKDEKCNIIDAAFGNALSGEVAGLMRLLIRKSREEYIQSVLEDFIGLVNEHKAVTKAQIVSAVPLSEKQLEDIVKTLSAKLKKRIVAEMTTDPSLIGGLRILVDGMVIDSSVKRKINDFKKECIAL